MLKQLKIYLHIIILDIDSGILFIKTMLLVYTFSLTIVAPLSSELDIGVSILIKCYRTCKTSLIGKTTFSTGFRS